MVSMSEDEQTPPTVSGEPARRGPFERFAETSSTFASSPPFFALCVVAVGVWIVGLLLGASDRFSNTAVGAMAALTLLLVVLLKNAELRAEQAIQLKLDAIAAALLEDKPDDKPAQRPLRGAIGLHDEI
jgi:low affinity Fe/Cu permease